MVTQRIPGTGLYSVRECRGGAHLERRISLQYGNRDLDESIILRSPNLHIVLAPTDHCFHLLGLHEFVYIVYLKGAMLSGKSRGKHQRYGHRTMWGPESCRDDWR